MAIKEYSVIVYDNGMVEWKPTDNTDAAKLHTMAMFRELVLDRKWPAAFREEKPTTLTAKDTGDYKGVACKGCAQCECADLSPSQPWRECNQWIHKRTPKNWSRRFLLTRSYGAVLIGGCR